MTREEEIKCASKDYVNYLLDKQEYHNENYTEDDIRQAFEKGAKWADANPKSPWIDYEKEKPPFGIEVIAYHHKWVDEDFNPTGTRVGFLGGDGFISAFWWDYQDCYETISKLHCESNKDFYRSHIDNTEPEFWLPIPKFSGLPKIGD